MKHLLTAALTRLTAASTFTMNGVALKATLKKSEGTPIGKSSWGLFLTNAAEGVEIKIERFFYYERRGVNPRTSNRPNQPQKYLLQSTLFGGDSDFMEKPVVPNLDTAGGGRYKKELQALLNDGSNYRWGTYTLGRPNIVVTDPKNLLGNH